MSIFRRAVDEIQVSLQPQTNEAFYMQTTVWWILLGTRNVSNKSCRYNPNTLFVFNN